MKIKYCEMMYFFYPETVINFLDARRSLLISHTIKVSTATPDETIAVVYACSVIKSA